MYKFSIDDIHNIRKKISKTIQNMSFEEIRDYYDKQEKIFNNNLERIKNKELQLA